MLTITSPGQEQDAAATNAAYVRSKGRRKASKSKGKAMVADTTTQDWVAHVRRIRDDRDQAAFAELFRHFAPRVKAFLMKGGASEPLAEECMQEAMATVWRKVDLFDPSRASVATWIFTIARNRRIDVIRKERRPAELPWAPEAEPNPQDALPPQPQCARLSLAPAALPEKQRTLVEQAYYGELSHSEIADATGLPLGTIKSRIRLALEKLRHSLK